MKSIKIKVLERIEKEKGLGIFENAKCSLAIDLTLAEVEKVIDDLIKDYGYCNCERNSNQMHKDIIKDLNKLKLRLRGN